MSDTRTIYLLTKDNIYCSDPKIKQSSDLSLTYLDMSDFDNLNPTRGTVVSGLAGAVSTYEPYDATITLTFKNRQERAEWIQKNSEQVYQIAVANTINQNRVYNKKCAITSFEFVENQYTNGIQTVLTLKLFGKWQSSLTEIEINSGTYSGGAKSYTRDILVRETDDSSDGVAGKPGADGKTPYVHTAWSRSSDGVDGFSTSYPITNLYTDTQNFDKLASWYSSNYWTKTTDAYKELAVIQSTTAWNGLSQYVKVKKGDFLTYSVYAKNISGTGTSSIYWILGSQTEGGYSGATVNQTANDVTITDSWQRVSGTTVATSDGYLRPRIERTNKNTNTLQIAGIKVEKGTTATPWYPSPADDPIKAYPSYRGEYADYTKADSTDPSAYTWGTPRVKKSYAYDSELKYGVTHYVSAIKLDGEHGFVIETEPRNGGLRVNLQSDYNGHQFALESNWPNLITGLSSEFVAYPYASFTTLDRFTMLAGGTVTSYGWNIENNEMPYLYEMFNNVEKYPISVGAVDQNGALVPIHVYTYTAQDFI